MAEVTSYGSEQRLDDGYELLLVLDGVSQQSGTDQDVVRAKLPDLLSQDWDFGDSQVEWPRCPGQGAFHASDEFCREQPADAALHGCAGTATAGTAVIALRPAGCPPSLPRAPGRPPVPPIGPRRAFAAATTG